MNAELCALKMRRHPPHTADSSLHGLQVRDGDIISFASRDLGLQITIVRTREGTRTELQHFRPHSPSGRRIAANSVSFLAHTSSASFPAPDFPTVFGLKAGQAVL